MVDMRKKSIENEAIHSRSLAYNRQLQLGSALGNTLSTQSIHIPEGAMLLENGNVIFSFHAPEAKSVSVTMYSGTHQLSKDNKGLWSAQIKMRPGFHPVFFRIDDVEVINPMAPIGFGWSKPINCVDVPGEESAFYLMQEVPHGCVVQDFFPSKATGQIESCITYLPPGYFTGSGEYPVLYLQHGHGENEQCWVHQGKVNFIADNLIAESKAVPCIIVMNNGMVQVGSGDERHMDAELFEKLLLNDCIPFIENRYRVKKDSYHRGMAGLSMGSMQTSIITFKHPDMFSWVGLFSGFVRMFVSGYEKNKHLRLLDDKERFISSFHLFFRAIGKRDNLIDYFENDSKLLEEKNLMP